MKYLSVCSGIEAATVAWHGRGWQPVAFAEIEPFPAAVLAHHYPTVPNLSDLTKYREWPEELLAQVDLLVGGTPCQAFSVAGKRQSLDDERGNLSLVYVNLYHHINEVRKRHGRPPAIALWENVPGVLSTKDNAFGCFLGGLLGCDEAPQTESGKWDKAGFLSSETVRVGYRVLDAQYFAVAQRRRRVFLVAVPCELIASVGERACPSEILSLRESVLGNPPTRGEARQAVARGAAERAASGGEPYHLDRAMFNQGVNAQYEPQITDDGVAASMVARGPAAVAFGGNRTSGPLDVATSCLANGSPHGRMDFASETFVVGEPTEVFPCIDANVDSKFGSNQWVDGKQYVLQGQAMAVRTAQTSANGHGVADEVAHTLDQVQGQAVAVDLQNVAIGGDVAGTLDTTRPSRGGGQAVATPIDLRQASRGEKVTNNRSSGSGGPPGSGVGDAGDPAFTVSERGQAVAFKPSHYTRGKDGKPDEVAPPLSADADKGDQDTLIMRQSIGFNWQNGGGYGNANDGLGITEEGTGPLSRSQVPACVTGQRTHALTTRAAAVEEDGTGRGTPIVPVQCGVDTYNQTVSDVSIPLRVGNAKDSMPAAMVPFTKAKRAQSVNDDESWVPGEVAPTQNQFDVGDTRATTVVAFANRTRDGVKVPEVMKDGVAPALTNPGQGGRSDAVNVLADAPVQVQWASGGGKVENPTMQALRTSAEHSYQFIRQAMQVRRLTPKECCRLQGFPDDHCDIIFRKKPAADGPKYRALGNSMAVPCMWWLGYRIDKATRPDNP